VQKNRLAFLRNSSGFMEPDILLVVRITIQMNLVSTPLHLHFKINFNIVFILTPLPSRVLSLELYTKTVQELIIYSFHATFPLHFILLISISLIMSNEYKL
jgi:hypothetical protein